MPLSREEVNPLSVLNFRKLQFTPLHFTKITIENLSGSSTNLIDQWINYHLNSRYSIKSRLVLNHANKVIESIEIGIEDPKEISMLTLGCPYIHQTKKEI
jgi:hypothetical protein